MLQVLGPLIQSNKVSRWVLETVLHKGGPMSTSCLFHLRIRRLPQDRMDRPPPAPRLVGAPGDPEGHTGVRLGPEGFFLCLS